MKRFILLFAVSLLGMVAVPKDLIANDNYLTYEELKKHHERLLEDQWSKDLVVYAQTLVGKRTGQCVLALRQRFGVPRNEVAGLAKHTKINSPTGKVGSVIVFKKMSWAGHVGIILKDEGDGWRYFDSNGDFTQRGAIRWISKTDPRISGYRIINYQNN